MGWSCTTKASETERKWQEACRKSTGSSNSWDEPSGHYFYEIGSERPDGSINGSVWRETADGRCRKDSSFRINPDGTIASAPAFLKAASESVR